MEVNIIADFLRKKNSAAGHWVHHPINFW